MVRKSLILLFLFCFFFLSAFRASADDFFYDGPVQIDKITAEIQLDQAASSHLVYLLTNRSEQDQTVEITYIDPLVPLFEGDQSLVNPLLFNPWEAKEIELNFQSELDVSLLYSFSLDPTLMFDGKRNAARVTEFIASIVMPEGIEQIVGSNKDYTRSVVDAKGRTTYTWEKYDSYPTPLSVKWSEVQLDVRFEKGVSPESITEPDQLLEVRIEIENLGDNRLEGLVLRDEYIPSDFEAVQEDEHLVLMAYELSDPRLIWQVDIPQLNPGESKIFSYNLRYVGDVALVHSFNVKPCMVFLDDKLVTTSNYVQMKKSVGVETQAPQQPTDRLYVLIILTIGATVLGLILIGAGIVLSRRRRSS